MLNKIFKAENDMIAFGICSHGFQLSGYDRGELGVLFSDDVISLEELLKGNLKKDKKHHF